MITAAARSASLGILSALALCGSAVAQDLKVTGLDGHSVTLTPAAIAALPHVNLTVMVEGKTTAYAGVPLAAILAKIGAPAGKAIRGKDLGDVVLVSSSDGYMVVLGLTETDSLFRKDRVLLADKADGAAIPNGQGPYRLVVEGDLRGARLARMVTSLELRQLTAAPR